MADSKSELRELKRSGAKPQPNSGRGYKQKGDGKLGPFVVDIKEFSNEFGLSKKVWMKVSLDAVKSGNLEPALKVVLGDSESGLLRLWVIQDDMFEQLLEAWMEKYEQ